MRDIASWLSALGMAHLNAIFEEQKIDFDVLLMLDEADLKDIGVVAMGERKRLLKAIGDLSQESVQAAAPEQTESIRDPLPSLVAERRQLTVMFCDLVDSTVLATTRDPEDYRALMTAYHETVTKAVTPFAGHVARFLGDGVLVYFGYPHAHEDEAGRAVRAGLSVLSAVEGLQFGGGLKIRTRIGIATGMVVVGEVGTGTAAAEKSAAGETPNLAARLQTVAGPGEIVISAETQQLLDTSIELEPLGKLELKGFALPVVAWRVIGERSIVSRFEARVAQGVARFIGRDSEVSFLLERWEMAQDGDGQVVLLSGEAGIGKSRICLTLHERIERELFSIVQLQCSPYFVTSALYPIVKYLERSAGVLATDTAPMRLQKLEGFLSPDLPSGSVHSILRLMGEFGLETGGIEHTPQQEKASTLAAICDLLIAYSVRTPLLFLVEDAHWIDPTTEDLLAQLVHRGRNAAILTVVTGRPEYVPTWANAANLTRLTLNRLGQRQCANLIEAIAGGKPLPAEVIAEIVRKTDGVPLFVEELTRTVVQSGLLEETPSGYRLKTPMLALSIPSTLQDSLMARLDRLAPAKEVAQVGAAIGREFSHGLLSSVMTMDSAQLGRALNQLVDSGLISRREETDDVTYSFKHALIQDTAYNSMLKSQRAMHHARIAYAIESSGRDVANVQPELLAYHYQIGGNAKVAFKFWLQAGEQAARRSAVREAVSHFRAALELLPGVGEVEGNANGVELALQMQLGDALAQSEGYGAAETIQCYARARELASALGRVDMYVAACSGVGSSFWSAGRFRDVIDMFSHLSREQVEQLEPMSQVTRYTAIGVADHLLGELGGSWDDLMRAKQSLEEVELKDQRLLFGVFPLMAILGYASRSRAYQGHVGEAGRCIEEAYAWSEKQAHEPTRAWALQMKAWNLLLIGEFAEAVRISKQLLALSRRLGFKTRIATGLIALGRASVATGEVESGLSMLKEGYALWASAGGKFHLSEYAALAADVLLRAGHLDGAKEFLLIGEQLQETTEERFFNAELVRLRGQLADLEGDKAVAEERYREAMAIAESQGAMLFRLRAATDLAYLFNKSGRHAAGRADLLPVYSWFVERPDVPDFLRAKDALNASSHL